VNRLRKALQSIVDGLGLQKPLRARARRRMTARHKEQARFERQAAAARLAADANRRRGYHYLKFGPDLDQARGEALLRKAKRKDDKALKLDAKAEKAKAKAIVWKQRAKVFTQRIHNLHLRLDRVEKEIAEWKREHGVEIDGNKVTGGTARQRLRAALLQSAYNCAHGLQNNYYSMSGALPDLEHTIKGMPYGHRFDCSSYGTGIHKLCGLPDPNGGEYRPGATMYTGTMYGHCETIPESEAQPGDFILYPRWRGDTICHHVEVVSDPARKRTVGHGSAPIDEGVYDLFGDGLYVVKRNPALKPD
jgi:hypothetical protein